MHISVVLQGGHVISLEVLPNDTAAELRRRLVMEGVPAEDLRILFLGSELESNRALSSYNVQSDCTLHLFPKKSEDSAAAFAAALCFKERKPKTLLTKAASAPAMAAPPPPLSFLDLRGAAGAAALPGGRGRSSPKFGAAKTERLGASSPKHRGGGSGSPKLAPIAEGGRASPKAFAGGKRDSPKFGSQSARVRSPQKMLRSAGSSASIVVPSAALASGSSPLRRATGMAASVPLLHLA